MPRLVAGHSQPKIPRAPPPSPSRYFTFLKAKSSCFIFSLCGSVVCRRNLNFIILTSGYGELQSGRGWRRWDNHPGVLGFSAAGRRRQTMLC